MLKNTGCSHRRPGFSFSIHMVAYKHCNYSSRASDTLFWSPQILGMGGTQIYIYIYTGKIFRYIVF